MVKIVRISILLLVSTAPFLTPGNARPERVVLTPGMSEQDIAAMNPANVDARLLPLERVEDLELTGIPPDIDIETWALEIGGAGAGRNISLSYTELLELPMISKEVLMICPGLFVDHARWEGVVLKNVLRLAGAARNYSQVTFQGADGYKMILVREKLQSHQAFLAVKVNDQVLPIEHGYPVRLVVEGMGGGVWVKWIESIIID